MNKKIKVFVIADWYLPGYKSGGAVISVSNMVEALSKDFQFYILTHDRDFTETKSYDSIIINEWVSVGNGQVYYASRRALSLLNIQRVINEIDPDIIYLNIFFSTLTVKCLILRHLRLIPQCPVILAPMGTFSPGALRLKAWKKTPFIRFAAVVGLYQNIVWRASSPKEKNEIQEQCEHALNLVNTPPFIKIAPDMADRRVIPQAQISQAIKKAGNVKFVFVSRISRMKNLDQALQFLGLLTGNIEFGIYGFIEDRDYWADCLNVIKTLPPNVVVEYHGHINHSDVPFVLSQHHFFFLPTLGENYGHAILEAMEAQVPVIISDKTPWHNLTRDNAGWNISLDDIDSWQRILQACVDMSHEQYSQMKENTKKYLSIEFPSELIRQSNIELLLFAYNQKISGQSDHSPR